IAINKGATEAFVVDVQGPGPAKKIRPGGCNPTARSLRDRSFVFSSVGLTHRKRLVELWLLFKIH
ncbi:hypothetical protein SJ937_14460, partial [Enterococcus faecium]